MQKPIEAPKLIANGVGKLLGMIRAKALKIRGLKDRFGMAGANDFIKETFQPLEVAGQGDDRGAVGGEALGQGAADALRSPRNGDDAAGEEVRGGGKGVQQWVHGQLPGEVHEIVHIGSGVQPGLAADRVVVEPGDALEAQPRLAAKAREFRGAQELLVFVGAPGQ